MNKNNLFLDIIMSLFHITIYLIRFAIAYFRFETKTTMIPVSVVHINLTTFWSLVG